MQKGSSAGSDKSAKRGRQTHRRRAEEIRKKKNKRPPLSFYPLCFSTPTSPPPLLSLPNQTPNHQDAGKPVAAAEAKAKAKASGAAASKASSSSSSAAAVDLASDPLALWAPVVPRSNPLPFTDPKQPVTPLPDSSDGTECLKWDDSLWSHADHFKYRWNVFKGIRAAIDANEGGLDNFSKGYEKYGFNRGVGGADGKQPGIWYREWAPGARAVGLVGEFNSWEPKPEHWASKDDFGVWSLFLPDASDGTSAIPHRTKVKARVETAYGEWVERIPAWIKWVSMI